MMVKSQKNRLWLLAGVPGAGKSTWVNNHKHFFSDKMKIISRDAIRFSLLKDTDEYFSKEKEVWKEFVKQAIESLSENVDTIIDATHLNEASRGKILRALKDCLTNVEINIIVINTPLNVALERNELREGRAYVPPTAIKNMWTQMTTPSTVEGFDNIYIYTEENGKVKYQIINKKGSDF